MGCDYFISKFLEIKFVNSMSEITIELEIDKGYYSFSLDEDDPMYDEKYTEYVEKILYRRMEPILIYDLDQFTSKKLEDKYRVRIEEELEKYNKYREVVERKEWKDIREIVKREVRYERE